MHIDGTTRLAGLIGWPLDHTLSPAMHNAAYAALGLDWVYIPLAVRDGASLAKLVAGLRALPMLGFNVTMPYKRIMMNLCDEVATQAQLAGAVNTVHMSDGRLIGYNTDGRGLLDSLYAEADFAPEGRRAVIIGAGGAAGAAVVALMLGRASHIAVSGRRMEHVEDLVERVGRHARDTEIVAIASREELQSAVGSADLVINATPLGMSQGDELPLPAEWLGPEHVVSDLIYRPAETAFMKAATERGARAVGGLGMLVAQGAMSIEIWNEGSGVPAPRGVMRAAAESELAAIEARTATEAG